jgi:hypothetical protein
MVALAKPDTEEELPEEVKVQAFYPPSIHALQLVEVVMFVTTERAVVNRMN